MSGYLLGDIITGFFSFLSSLFKSIGTEYGPNIVFFAGVGIMTIVLIIGIFRMATSFERRTTRCVNKINRYLLQNPAITEDNLVQFHKLLQKMPERIRDRWQLYILERDGLPSRYLTAEYCIRRPLASSALLGVKQQVWLSAIVLAIFTFIFGLGLTSSIAPETISTINFIDFGIIYPLFTPMVVLFMAAIFSMIVSARYNFYNSNLYRIFAVFVRNLNRAVATLPDSIDYQVLFTQKEIDDGIPILREYLEKERLEEQRLLEQSKYAAISHSPYNFEDLGVDGEQLISRAVNESENFLMKKIGLQNEIQEYEKKLAQAQANMDEIEKEANRKLQTIKENLERLDKAISETTNRVEINYNKRQIKDEMEKRAAIEKDLKSLLSKEQVTVNECNSEIEKRKEMIEQDKDSVEKALKSEYNTFAVKVYDTLSDKINDENAEVAKDYQSQIVDLKSKIQNLSREIESKDAMISERDLFINTLQGNINYSVDNFQQQQQLDGNNPDYNGYVQPEQAAADGQQNYMTTENVAQNPIYYDENGNVIDYSQYYDENGNFVDYSQFYDENGNYIGPNQEEWNQMYGQAAEQEQAGQVEGETQPEEVAQVQEEQTEQEPVAQEEQVESQEEAEQVVEQQKTKPQTKPKKTTKSSSKKPSSQKQTSKKETDEDGENTKKPRPRSRALANQKPKQEKTAEKPKTRKKTSKINVADESVNYAVSKDDFDELQKRIDAENKKIKQNKDELQIQIDKALTKMGKSNSGAKKDSNIKQIKDLIEQLKEKAKQAKQDGASKDEIKNINAQVAELVDAITKYSLKK